MLEAHLDKLHVIAEALLRFETISGEEFQIAFEKGLDALTEQVDSSREIVEEERRASRAQDEIDRVAFEKANEKKEDIEHRSHPFSEGAN